jgi:hypothetical protein
MAIRRRAETVHTAALDVRANLFTMRMSDQEWSRAEAIAKHYGISKAELVRMLLKDRERDIWPPEKSTPPPRKR